MKRRSLASGMTELIGSPVVRACGWTVDGQTVAFIKVLLLKCQPARSRSGILDRWWLLIVLMANNPDTDGENNFVWESASITNRGDDFIDVSFVSEQGDLHWVIYDDLAGAYQYFVNRDLGDISILRSLFRLDPDLFPNGRTYLKDEPLPSFELILNSTKVQDETFETSNGTYITKYDWSNYVRDRDFNGIYGPSTGSWFIHPSTDYFSGNHLKQTLTVRPIWLFDRLVVY